MELIQSLIEKAKVNPKRIVFPEGEDERIIMAASKVHESGIARPVLLGNPGIIDEIANKNNASLTGIEIIDFTNEADTLEKYAELYAQSRDVKLGVAKKMVKKALGFGGMMVKTGDADGMVAGVANATASVIQFASLTIGLQKGFTIPSSFFIMVVPEFLGEKDKVFIFADCAVNVSPDSKELAEIGVASGMNAQSLLGLKPKIAFLSFSTKGSASHADTDKVIEAVRYAKELNQTFDIDGELQGDSALIPKVAQKKVKESTVAGDANTLIFPDLDAGNICYKLVQYLGNAKAYGPILQGFAKPVNDLSRGASVEDIVGVTAISVVQAQSSN